MLRIFQVYVPRSLFILLLAEIFLAASCFVAAGYMVLELDPWLYFFDENGIWNVLIVVLSITGGLYFQDMYTEFRVHSRTLLVQQLCTAVGMALLVQSMLYYTSPRVTIPRWLMLYGALMAIPVLGLLRWLYSSVGIGALGLRRILFLGRSETVQRVAAEIDNRPELGLATVGFVDDGAAGADHCQPLLGSIDRLREIVRENRPDQIVVGLTERRQRLPVMDLLDLKFSGIRIEEVGQTYEMTHHRVSLKDLRPSDLVFSSEVNRSSRLFGQVQSLYSWVLALIGGLVTLPVIAVVWVLVRITSPGAAIYSQVRSGLNGQPFRVYKFRSMRVDAEAKTGAVWASKNDPRITPIGRWLRLLRLDELPQFWNVLRGEMNIVGPRPERPEFVRTLQEQIPFYRQRLLVKPGLTGWAQINHKYGDSIEDTITKLEYDLYYIKHRNMSLDFYIMFQTLKVMLLHRGAQ